MMIVDSDETLFGICVAATHPLLFLLVTYNMMQTKSMGQIVTAAIQALPHRP